MCPQLYLIYGWQCNCKCFWWSIFSYIVNLILQCVVPSRILTCTSCLWLKTGLLFHFIPVAWCIQRYIMLREWSEFKLLRGMCMCGGSRPTDPVIYAPCSYPAFAHTHTPMLIKQLSAPRFTRRRYVQIGIHTQTDAFLTGPQLLGRPVIRSIATWVNGGAFLGTEILYRGVHSWWVRFLFCWQVAHPFTYCSIHHLASGQ